MIQQSGNAAGITVGTGDKNVAALGTPVALQAVTLSVSRPPPGHDLRPHERHGRADERPRDDVRLERQRLPGRRGRHDLLQRQRRAAASPSPIRSRTASPAPFSVNYPVLCAACGRTRTRRRRHRPNFTSATFTWTASAAAAPGSLADRDATPAATRSPTRSPSRTTRPRPTGGAISVPANSYTLNNIAITHDELHATPARAWRRNVITRSNASGARDPRRLVPRLAATRGATVVTSPDTVPTDGMCYVYTLTGTDNVGNVAARSPRARSSSTRPRRSRPRARRGVSSLTFAATVPNKPMRMLIVGAEAEFATNNSCQASGVTLRRHAVDADQLVGHGDGLLRLLEPVVHGGAACRHRERRRHLHRNVRCVGGRRQPLEHQAGRAGRLQPELQQHGRDHDEHHDDHTELDGDRHLRHGPADPERSRREPGPGGSWRQRAPPIPHRPRTE